MFDKRIPFLPKKKISYLKRGKKYLVSCLTMVHTQDGWKTIIEVEKKFDIILPDWLSKIVKNNETTFFNLNDKVQLFIKYVQKGWVEFCVCKRPTNPQYIKE